MTKIKLALTAGTLLLASSAFAQVSYLPASAISVSGGAAKTGQEASLSVTLHPTASELSGGAAYLTLVIDVASGDNDNVDLSGTPVVTAPNSKWDDPFITISSDAPAGVKRFVMQSGTKSGLGDTTDPLVFKFSLTQKGSGLAGAKLSVVGYDENTLTGSNVADNDGNTVGIHTMATGIVNGVSKDLGGVMNNTVSVAPGVLAAAAGTKLYLLDPASDTLADLNAGWTGGKDIGGTVTGRPAFGGIDGALAVAVGADNGDLSIFDVTTGNSLGKVTGTFSGIGVAPAIDANGNVFVAGKVGTGISVASVKVSGGTATVGSPNTVAEATAATSSPAVANGVLILGTDKGVFRATVDNAGVITPQATSGIDAAINTSPVVNAGSAFVADATGNVYKINISTGAVQQTSAALPGPLSNPFAQGDHVLFGGTDGKVHSLKVADLSDTVSDFAANPLVTPVDTGSAVYAGAIDGTVGAVGGATVNVGGPLGSAISVLPAANQILVNTTNGTVFAIPIS